MNKKQKTMLLRILATAALMVILHFVPVTGPARFLLYLIPYLLIGHDVLAKAWYGIRNRQVFDECFLMVVATLGAIVLALTTDGDYTEAVAVMLFYQVGEVPDLRRGPQPPEHRPADGHPPGLRQPGGGRRPGAGGP